MLAFPTLAAAPAAFQGYRLNDPLAREVLGGIAEIVLSPGGEKVAMLANLGEGHHLDLFVVPVDGSSSARQLTTSTAFHTLSDARFSADGTRVLFLRSIGSSPRNLLAFPSDGSAEAVQLGWSVRNYQPAPSSNRAVFVADKEVSGKLELYSVPYDRSSGAVKLSGAMTGTGIVRYLVSPDGSRVVYLADQEVSGQLDLYSAPIDGSAAATRLNLPRPRSSVQDDFAISFDSLGVIYRSDQDSPGMHEIYATPIEGGSAPLKRSRPLGLGGDVFEFQLSPVDGRLVYRAKAEELGAPELYSVEASTGGGHVRLNDPLPTGSRVGGFELAPDARYVAYRADQRTRGDFQLFAVPADRSTPPIQLSQTTGGAWNAVTSYQIAPAGDRLVYSELGDEPSLFSEGPLSRAFSVPLDGSAGPLALGSHHTYKTPQLSSDGKALLLAPTATGLVELYVAPIDGSAPIAKRSGPQASGGGVSQVFLTNTGIHALYTAFEDHPQSFGLYATALSGGPTWLLSPGFRIGEPKGTVSALLTSATGEHAAYVAPEGQARNPDLYGVATDGSGSSKQLNPTLGREPIYLENMSPDGAHVVCTIGSSPWEQARFLMSIDTPRTPVSLGTSGDPPLFTPDSTALVYSASTGSSSDLWVVRSDGSAAPERLHSAHTRDQWVRSFGISPSGASVVYARSTHLFMDLLIVPVDGHKPPTMLVPTLVGGDYFAHDPDMPPCIFTPDESRIVYLAKQQDLNRTELYVVPTDGSQAPIRVNPPLTQGGDVMNPPLITPDSTRVVYLADQEVNGRFELYVAPITGGLVHKLNGPLGTYNDVSLSFAVSPDSTHAVYVSNEEALDRYELWSAPLDGSTPRVKISGTLDAGEDVERFAIPPDSTRVVYSTRVFGNGDHLWSTPLDGSAPPMRLSLILHDTEVLEFQATADGKRVVYKLGIYVPEARRVVYELFVVPVDGSAAPRRVSGPLVEGGSVVSTPGSFRVTANDLVLYLADQDAVGRIELYASALDWRRGPRRSN
ncbi:MAG: hypothetical protein ABL998_06110 [Planctomycetota bacterium]